MVLIMEELFPDKLSALCLRVDSPPSSAFALKSQQKLRYLSVFLLNPVKTH